jgi:hypothetical protein
MRAITTQQRQGIHGLDAQIYVTMMRRVTFWDRAPPKGTGLIRLISRRRQDRCRTVTVRCERAAKIDQTRTLSVFFPRIDPAIIVLECRASARSPQSRQSEPPHPIGPSPAREVRCWSTALCVRKHSVRIGMPGGSR